MGNNQTSNWRQEFDLLDHTSPIKRAIHRQTKQRYEVLTLVPTSEEEQQALLNRIKLRTAKSSPHLLPLHSFWRSSDFTACSSRPSIDLIFRTATPLEEYFTFRKVKNETFSREEVEYIVARVAAALGDIREMREEYGAVHLGTVFVDGAVRLKDPLLVKAEGGRKGKKVQGFPSPQKLYTYFDTLSTFEEHTSDLFSLGILALQLIYPHQNLAGIYKNANSRYLNCSIDANELRTFVNSVTDPLLRRYVTVLTDEQPNRRREIYQLLEGRQVSTQNLKILTENPYEIFNAEEKHNPEKQAMKLDDGRKLINPVARTSPEVGFAQRTIVKFDLSQKQREVQSFTVPMDPPLRTTPPPPTATANIPTFFSTQFKPAEVQSWRPSHIFESTYRNPREDASESTPINKINGNSSNSFRSPAFDFTFPKPNTQLQPPYVSYQFQEERQMGKVSPKFIEATYRSSFIPVGKQQVGNSAITVQSVIEQKHIINSQIEKIGQKQSKLSPPQQQSPSAPLQIPPNRQLSPQLQVKTSIDVADNPKSSFIQATRSEPTQNIIKFESMASKIVQSVNQIQKQQRSSSEKDGFIVEEYDIGTRYEGFKANGMRNGQGEFIYKQGSKYKGEWKDNKMQGFGTLYYPNGAIAYEGQWLDDEFDGQGTVYNDTPSSIKGGFDYTNFNSLDEEWLKYEGQLKRDAKDGQGKLYLTNGEVYSGLFENDLVHGEGEFRRYNGSVIKGIWQEGLLKKIYQ